MSKHKLDEPDDFGIDLDMPEFDGDMGVDGGLGGREPLETPVRSFTSGVKSSVISGQALSRTLKGALPVEYSTAWDMVDEGATFASDLKDEVKKSLDPEIKRLKGAVKTVLPGISGVLPKTISDRLDKALATEDERAYNAQLSKQQVDDASIASAIGDIWKAQEAKNIIDMEESIIEKTERNVSENLAAERSLSVSSSTRALMERLVNYQDSVTSSYQRKTLELQFRQYFAARDLLEIAQATLKDAVSNLKIIAHNTGLPDTQKELAGETFSKLKTEALYGTVLEGASSLVSSYGGRIKDAILGKVRDVTGNIQSIISAGAGLAEMQAQMASLGDMADEELTPEQLAIRQRLQATEKAGGLVGDTLIEKLVSKLNPLASENETIRNVANQLGYYTENWQTIVNEERKKATDIDTGYEPLNNVLNTLGDLFKEIIPDIGVHEDRMVSTLSEHATRVSQFDELTRRSIIEIIPGYLSRILQGVQQIATGDDETDRMVYDLDTESFLYKEEAINQFREKLTGESKIAATRDAFKQFLAFIDPKEVLTGKDQAILRKQLITDSLENLRFNPFNYVKESGFSDTIPEDSLKRIKSVMTSMFRRNEKGNPDTTQPALTEASRLYEGLKSVTDSNQLLLNKMSDTGQREIADHSGYLLANNRLDRKRLIDELTAYDEEKDITKEKPAALPDSFKRKESLLPGSDIAQPMLSNASTISPLLDIEAVPTISKSLVEDKPDTPPIEALPLPTIANLPQQLVPSQMTGLTAPDEDEEESKEEVVEKYIPEPVPEIKSIGSAMSMITPPTGGGRAEEAANLPAIEPKTGNIIRFPLADNKTGPITEEKRSSEDGVVEEGEVFVKRSATPTEPRFASLDELTNTFREKLFSNEIKNKLNLSTLRENVPIGEKESSDELDYSKLKPIVLSPDRTEKVAKERSLRDSLLDTVEATYRDLLDRLPTRGNESSESGNLPVVRSDISLMESLRGRFDKVAEKTTSELTKVKGALTEQVEKVSTRENEKSLTSGLKDFRDSVASGMSTLGGKIKDTKLPAIVGNQSFDVPFAMEVSKDLKTPKDLLASIESNVSKLVNMDRYGGGKVYTESGGAVEDRRGDDAFKVDLMELINSINSGVLTMAGAVDEGFFKERSIINRLSSGFMSTLGKGFELGGSLFGGTIGLGMDIGSGIGGIFKSGWRGLTGEPVMDIYYYGENEKEPRLRRRKLIRGDYLDVKSKESVRYIKDIKGEVVDVTNDNEVIISEDEFNEGGLYTRLSDGKIGTLLEGAKRLSIGSLQHMFDITTLVTTLPRKLMDLSKMVGSHGDLYTPGVQGPILLSHIMRKGGYRSLRTGKPIFKYSDIDGPVADINGDIVLSMEQMKEGLFDKKGKRVDLRSFGGKVFDFFWGLGSTTAGLTAKTAKAMYTGASKVAGKGIDYVTGKVKGWAGGGESDKLIDLLKEKGMEFQDKMPDMEGILRRVSEAQTSSMEKLREVSLGTNNFLSNIEITGNKQSTILTDIYTLLDQRLEVPESLRVGSWQEKRLRKKEAGEATGQNIVPATGSGKMIPPGGVMESLLGIGAGNTLSEMAKEAVIGSVTDKATDALTRGGSRLGRGLKSAGKGLGGGVLAGGKKLLGAATTLGSGLATAGMGSTAGTLATGAAAAAGKIGALTTGLVGGVASILSSPVVIGGAALAGTAYLGYKFYQSMQSDKRKPRPASGHISAMNDPYPLESYRLLQYGINASDGNICDVVRALEDKAMKSASVGGDVTFDLTPAQAYETFAEGFGYPSDDEESLIEWSQWYEQRFLPILVRYMVTIADNPTLKDVYHYDALEIIPEDRELILSVLNRINVDPSLYRVVLRGIVTPSMDDITSYHESLLERLKASVSVTAKPEIISDKTNKENVPNVTSKDENKGTVPTISPLSEPIGWGRDETGDQGNADRVSVTVESPEGGGRYDPERYRGDPDQIERFRFMQYGINPQETYKLPSIRVLEQEIALKAGYKVDKLKSIKPYDAYKKFGKLFPGTDASKWVGWYGRRFAPILSKYIAYCNDNRISNIADILPWLTSHEDKWASIAMALFINPSDRFSPYKEMYEPFGDPMSVTLEGIMKAYEVLRKAPLLLEGGENKEGKNNEGKILPNLENTHTTVGEYIPKDPYGKDSIEDAMYEKVMDIDTDTIHSETRGSSDDRMNAFEAQRAMEHRDKMRQLQSINNVLFQSRDIQGKMRDSLVKIEKKVASMLEGMRMGHWDHGDGLTVEPGAVAPSVSAEPADRGNGVSVTETADVVSVEPPIDVKRHHINDVDF